MGLESANLLLSLDEKWVSTIAGIREIAVRSNPALYAASRPLFAKDAKNGAPTLGVVPTGSKPVPPRLSLDEKWVSTIAGIREIAVRSNPALQAASRPLFAKDAKNGAATLGVVPTGSKLALDHFVLGLLLFAMNLAALSWSAFSEASWA
jgi:hypothetical protein